MFNEVEHGPTPQKKKKNLGDTGKLKYMGKRVDTWHGQRPLPKNKVKDKWPQKITSKKKKNVMVSLVGSSEIENCMNRK